MRKMLIGSMGAQKPGSVPISQISHSPNSRLSNTRLHLGLIFAPTWLPSSGNGTGREGASAAGLARAWATASGAALVQAWPCLRRVDERTNSACYGVKGHRKTDRIDHERTWTNFEANSRYRVALVVHLMNF